MHARRPIALMTMSLVATVHPVRSLLLLLVPQPLHRRSFTQTVSRSMAAPGVDVAPADAIRRALADPSVTLVDARSVGEIEQYGYYNNNDSTPAAHRWVHAEATPQNAPLLQVAAAALLPDKEAPVVIYCASGIRATTCKNVLEQQGYTNVLNAGGLADLKQAVMEE